MNVVSFPAPANPAPVNVEAEQQVLGAILVNNDAYHRVSNILRPEHFAEELHRRIYDIIEKLIGEGKAATPVTLKTYLGDHDLGGMTTAQYLARLLIEATTVLNAADYAEMIVDLYCRREAIEIAADVVSLATFLPNAMRPSELLDEASERLVALREATAPPDAAETNAQTLGRIIERGEAFLRGDPTGALPTGVADLDNRLGGGLRAGRLVVMAGRPGAGKTAVELALATRLAQQGVGVGIFSLEIDRDENISRMISAMLRRTGGRVQPSYSAITTGRMTEAEIEALVYASKAFADLPVELDCSASITMAQVEARAKRMMTRMERKGQKLGAVFIDYLQLLKMQDRYKGNQVAEYGEAVLHAKNMAKRLGIAVVLLSQLNRAVEQREDKRPMMSDLRGSGNIEEHADAIALLYRPAYYDAKDPNINQDPALKDLADARANDLEVIVDKNRLGSPGRDTLYIDVARCFVDSKARY